MRYFQFSMSVTSPWLLMFSWKVPKKFKQDLSHHTLMKNLHLALLQLFNDFATIHKTVIAFFIINWFLVFFNRIVDNSINYDFISRFSKIIKVVFMSFSILLFYFFLWRHNLSYYFYCRYYVFLWALPCHKNLLLHSFHYIIFFDWALWIDSFFL